MALSDAFKAAHHSLLKKWVNSTASADQEKTMPKFSGCCLLWINKAKATDKMYMSVGVMKDYKLTKTKEEIL